MNRLDGLVRNLPHFMRSASLLEIETLIRGIAVELAERDMPDTHKLFDYARLVERFRAAVRGEGKF